MTDPRDQILASMLLEEAAVAPEERPLHWLSFADPDASGDEPGGPGFLGVVITEGVTIGGAVLRTHHLKLNPGGEVMSVGPIPRHLIPEHWWNRLLTKADVDALEAEMETQP